ncbi:MAG TPA: toxic anion resistance protein [Candidatus Spyradocola merdavium]|nr:toxic anion resistance protein [Candidatus Spyradocola merdavium]
MASEITLDALTKRKAEAQSPQVETAPTPAQTDAVRRAVEALTPEERAKAEEIKNGIDLMDSQTAILYGVGAQRNLAEFSDNILANVRNKDTGYVGDLMGELVEKVRDVGVDEAEGGVLDKLPFLRSAARAVRRLLARYEKIEVQIDRIQRDLEEARMQMLKDIAMFDGLYEKNLEYFRGLQVYIVAGEEKLRETREETLPRLRAEAQAKGDPMSAQVVRDFEDTVDRFEKKLHDLKLSKAIAIQTAPQIRLIQNNDKLLVDKIQTAILSTIPLWKGQIVIALGLARQQSALQMQRSVTDTTNELLQKNAELLKQNSLDVARESERGIVDLETLKKVNDDLISTIEETIQIQREGRAARQSAEAELAGIEQKLKDALLTAAQAD